MDPTSQSGELAPASGQERHEFVDVLRGFALAGIVLANMISYSLYLSLGAPEKMAMATAATDRWLDFLELVFIEAKFYTIFSVLFGVGFSILMTRADAKGIDFHRFFLRRALFLFLIGLAHGLLFWHNDILRFYAVCGALLLPFVRARSRTILTCSILALLTPVAVKAFDALPHGTFTGPRDLIFQHFGFTSSRVAHLADGAAADIIRYNFGLQFSALDYVVTSGMILKIYGCFLLGLLIGRSGIHERLPRYASVIRRTAVTGLAIGIPLNVLYAWTFQSESLLHEVIAAVAILPMSAGYVCALAWLWARPDVRGMLQHFNAVGRMALTNYVGQSVICTFVFYGTGFGLGGTVGPTVYLPIGLAVYMLQVILSRWWLARFQFGPLEWIWRMMTYGTWVRLRKPAMA